MSKVQCADCGEYIPIVDAIDNDGDKICVECHEYNQKIAQQRYEKWKNRAKFEVNRAIVNRFRELEFVKGNRFWCHTCHTYDDHEHTNC